MSLGCYTDPNQPAIDCAVQGLQGAVGGEAVFALLIGGLMTVGFYIATDGGLAVPSVILAILGTFVITSLPPQYQSTAQVLIFLGLVAGLLALAQKYVTEA